MNPSPAKIEQSVALFGRGVVLSPEMAVPERWRNAPLVEVAPRTLTRPKTTAMRLHHLWLERTPVVVRLSLDPQEVKRPRTWDVEPYDLTESETPFLDMIHHLVWSNNYWLRFDGSLFWTWGEVARRDCGAMRAPDNAPGDVMLPSGAPAWVDGGPREPLTLGHTKVSVIHWETVEEGSLLPVPLSASSQDGKQSSSKERSSLSSLAPDQLRAVLHSKGAARVIAPAGSGKTRVLTARLRHLMVDRGYEHRNVIALTFNKRAQEEMESRCSDFRPNVRTLNSLGLEIVSDYRGGVRTVTELDIREALKRLVSDLELRVNTDALRPYLDALSRIRMRLETPDDVQSEYEDSPGLAEVFSRFRRWMRDRAVVDFDEQTYGAVEALLQDGDFRRKWQRRCRHLLVDEFQDLTPLTLLFVRLLSAPVFQVFGVGDDDQVLYEYSGADPRFLIDFKRYFPGAAEHALEVNYRSPPAVVESAGHLLARNKVRVRKVIRAPSAREGATPDIATSAGIRAMADALQIKMPDPLATVAETIDTVEEWLTRPNVRPADIAVLTRVNAMLLAPQVALLQRGHPVYSTLGPWLLERTGVRVALAYLRLALSPQTMAREDLVLVYRRPYRGINFGYQEFLETRKSWTPIQLESVQSRAAAGRRLDGFLSDLTRLATKARRADTRTLLRIVRTEIGLGKVAAQLDAGKSGEIEAHGDDLTALEEVATLHPDPATFEPWLRGAFRGADDRDGIVLATVHKVKGQEWDYVCIHGATEDVMPHRLCLEEVEAERRVMHVAITRARREVVLVADGSAPSRFLRELRSEPPSTKQDPLHPAITEDGARPGLPDRRKGARELAPATGDLVALGGVQGEVIGAFDGGIRVRLETGAVLLVSAGERLSVNGARGVLKAGLSQGE